MNSNWGQVWDDLLEKMDQQEEHIHELETVLKSATPVYKQTSDTLGEMGIVIEPTVMYYRIEPAILEKALDKQKGEQ